MIRYYTGDATAAQPIGAGDSVIIAHVCNDIGAFGSGFAGAVARRWPHVREAYLSLGRACVLGFVQYVRADSVTIANMIAQRGCSGPKPWLRENALRLCLTHVAEQAKIEGASVHMPRIGCGIAGSTWDRVEPIIADTCKDIEVYVYDLEVK